MKYYSVVFLFSMLVSLCFAACGDDEPVADTQMEEPYVNPFDRPPRQDAISLLPKRVPPAQDIVSNDPSFTELIAAADNNQDLEPFYARATQLREGLYFPRDTFAISEDRTIRVVHLKSGEGLVNTPDGHVVKIGIVNLGWMIFINWDNDYRHLVKYEPQ